MSEAARVMINLKGRTRAESGIIIDTGIFKSKANRLISLRTDSDKMNDYDTCNIVFDNDGIFFNDVFSIPIEKEHTIQAVVQSGMSGGKVIFGGVPVKSRSSYDASGGYTFELECRSYEWLLYKRKFKKKDEIKINDNPMILIKKLLDESGILHTSDTLEDFRGILYNGMKWEISAGTRYLDLIQRICLYMQCVFWIDHNRRAHITSRSINFGKIKRTNIKYTNKLTYGKDIISANFTEEDREYQFDRVETWAYTPSYDTDSGRRTREDNAAGRLTSDARILKFFAGFINMSNNTGFLKELAKELLYYFKGDEITASIKITGNQHVTTKPYKLTPFRDDQILLITPIPLDMKKSLKAAKTLAENKLIRQISPFIRAKRRNYTAGYYYVRRVIHDISTSGYTTELEICSKYVHNRQRLYLRHDKEINHMKNKEILIGFVENVNDYIEAGNRAKYMCRVKLEDGSLVEAILTTPCASINNGIIVRPKIGTQVLLARVGGGGTYIIGRMYTQDIKAGNNYAVTDEIRIGEYAIQIQEDEDGATLVLGASDGTSEEQIALANHTHTLTSTHTHPTAALGPPSPPTGQDSAQTISDNTHKSNTKIKCKSG